MYLVLTMNLEIYEYIGQILFYCIESKETIVG
jgi:hypothetical protein